MQVHRPLQLGLLTRCFSHRRRHHLVLSMLVGARLDGDGPFPLVTEADLWNEALAQMSPGTILDEGMWKPRGEVLVSGAAQAVGEPATGLEVRVAVGPAEEPLVDKAVYVVGDRHWEAGGSSAPVPFSTMPIAWERAYGGEDFADNPVGTGRGGAGALPNVEDPRALLEQPGDHPSPKAFEAIPMAWPVRIERQGTHDKTWLEQDFPGLARDVDWRCFNLAPDDQQLPAEHYFAGDEAFRVENMHAEQAVLEGTLPGVRARAFLRRRGADELEEVPAKLDTVRLFPNTKLVVLVFRALASVADDEASEVDQILGAVEALGEVKPRSHYAGCLAARLDPDRGGLASLRQGELLPAGCKSAIDLEAWDEEDEREGLKQANLRRRMDDELAGARQRLVEQGIDPDEHGVPERAPPEEPLPSLDELPEFLDGVRAKADEAKAEAEAKRAALEAEARKHCEERGLDYDLLARQGREQGGGPKLVDAEATLAQLRAQQQLAANAGVPLPQVEEALADPDLERRLREAEAQYHRAYRKVAHLMPEAATPAEDEGARLRHRVELAKASDTSLAEEDFTGAPLRGLDLEGMDLSRAFFERADLRGAKLRGATLKETMLARARLDEADLAGADLTKANLGAANLQGADLSGANLAGAVLAQADLRGARLEGADLRGADLMEADLSGAHLAGVVADDTRFLWAKLSGLELRGAKLDGAVFIESSLPGADLREASLGKTAFVECDASGANLAGAQASGVRFVRGSSLAGASFLGADLTEAMLAETDLTGADFSGASLGQANLTGADLTGAKLYRVRARQAMFTKAKLDEADLTGADLLDGLLDKTSLRGTTFKGANLFRAVLDDAQGDDRTSFESAHVGRVRRPRRPEER